MKKLIFSLLLFAVPVRAWCDVRIWGSVVDSDSAALPGASVIVKDRAGKIRKYGVSQSNGSFDYTLPDADGCRLEVNMMGHAKQSIALDSVAFPLTVRLLPGAFQLKEVAVKADKIREQGDTIAYNVGSFAQKQDRSIGDVLRRMPGIDVAKNGSIKYQGESINKFYIEGSDLMGGRYGVATNGISHNDVGTVEVMENHQPMKVLSGIGFSDKAAINLKLKSKAKARWTGYGDFGAGYSTQPCGAVWNDKLFALAVMPSFQSLIMLSTNNTGNELQNETTDFFGAERGTQLKSYFSLGLPWSGQFEKSRITFNKSAHLSANNLKKLKNGELKANFDYSFGRVTASSQNSTTYFLPDGSSTIVEDRNGREQSNKLAAKIIYESNLRTSYVNNTLTADFGWNNLDLSCTGTLNSHQTASTSDFFVGNTLKVIKRYDTDRGASRLITFNSDNQWQSMPGMLREDHYVYPMTQSVSQHALYTDENASFAFVVKGLTVSMETGLRGLLRKLDSQCSPSWLDESDRSFVNTVGTGYVSVYASPRIEYFIKRLDISVSMPLRLSRYEFDKTIANRTECYASPSMNVTWKPDSRVSLALQASGRRSPISLAMIYPQIIMSDYRSYCIGVKDFYSTSGASLMFVGSYRNVGQGLFGNIMGSISKSSTPFTSARQILGDYIMYSYSPAKSKGGSRMLNGSLSKIVSAIDGTVKLHGSYTHSTTDMLSETQRVASTSQMWNAGLSVDSRFCRWAGMSVSGAYSAHGLKTERSTDTPWMGNWEAQSSLNFYPHHSFNMNVNANIYSNELSVGNFKTVTLLDASASYQMNKRLEWRVSLSNIFNTKHYDYYTYSTLSSYMSRRNLRGRELLITLSIRK